MIIFTFRGRVAFLNWTQAVDLQRCDSQEMINVVLDLADIRVIFYCSLSCSLIWAVARCFLVQTQHFIPPLLHIKSVQVAKKKKETQKTAGFDCESRQMNAGKLSFFMPDSWLVLNIAGRNEARRSRHSDGNTGSRLYVTALQTHGTVALLL